MIGWLLALVVPQLIHGYTYPMFPSTKRYPTRGGYPTAAFIPVALPFATARRYPFDYEDQESDFSYPMYQFNEDPVDQQQSWSEAEASAAFLQNLILAQMYQDAASPKYVGRTDYIDNEKDRSWLYGVPITEVDDQARGQQMLREDDAEVNELEALRKKEEESKKKKEKEAARAARRKQKQKIVEQKKSLVSTTTLAPETILKNRGQQEYVLPQPSRHVSIRTAPVPDDRPSVYQTIKQLLTMEDELKQDSSSHADFDRRIRKRFISNDEQLATQLRNLSKRRIAI